MKTQSIVSAFQKIVQENPTATAVFDSRRHLSYGELAHLADSIAARLPEGCRRVGIIMDHSLGFSEMRDYLKLEQDFSA